MSGAASCHHRAGPGRSLGGDAPSALCHEGRAVCGQAAVPACGRCQALAGRRYGCSGGSAPQRDWVLQLSRVVPAWCLLTHVCALHTGSLFVYANVSVRDDLLLGFREFWCCVLLDLPLGSARGCPGSTCISPVWTGVIPSLSLSPWHLG